MWKQLAFDKKFDDIVQQLIASNTASYNIATRQLEFTQKPSYNIPWIFFTVSNTGRQCLTWSKYFKHFGLIPFWCRMHCWKVVCRPRTVWELKRFYDVMMALPWLYPQYIQPLTGKCGLDVRDYTSSAYGGFLYANSESHAYEILGIAQSVIIDNMENESINGEKFSDTLIVKRGCTEMEANCPTDSEKWLNYTSEDHLTETRLNSIFETVAYPSTLPDWHKNRIFYGWVKHAVMIGDKTAKWLGERLGDLSVHAVTYLPQQEETLKKEN